MYSLTLWMIFSAVNFFALSFVMYLVLADKKAITLKHVIETVIIILCGFVPVLQFFIMAVLICAFMIFTIESLFNKCSKIVVYKRK